MRGQLVVCCEDQRKSKPYTDALLTMGIDPERIVLVTPDRHEGGLSKLATDSAGVLLCGGPDLDPHWYGEEALPDANLFVLPELDRLEWQLLEGAEFGRSPVWALCRGMQTFNVFQGGTLWQDLPSQVEDVLEHQPDAPHDSLAHPIQVTDRSDSFADLMVSETTQVNSRHHQAIRDLGRRVRPLAESSDGVLEVIVLDRRDWWVKGVQWHPENLMHIPLQRLLWAEFLAAANDKATASDADPLIID